MAQNALPRKQARIVDDLVDSIYRLTKKSTTRQTSWILRRFLGRTEIIALDKMRKYIPFSERNSNMPLLGSTYSDD